MTLAGFATPEDIHAARPDVSVETVRRECRAGRVPGAMRAGRSWVIPLASAEAFVREFERYGRKSGAAPDGPGQGAAPPPERKAC